LPEIKEDFHVTEVNKVKDLELSFQLLEQREVHASSVVNGELKAVFVESDKPIQSFRVYDYYCEIVNERFPVSSPLKKSYFPQAQTHSVRAPDMMTFGVTNFFLNDSLWVEVEGEVGANVSVVVRYV
jgi:hypothetical protein